MMMMTTSRDNSWSLLFPLAIFVALLSNATTIAEDPPKLELLIRNGRVIDGTGGPWYVADIGIRSGKIERIGVIDANESDRVIDATGLIVAPGFIDMMGQNATPMMLDPKSALNLLTQGITTINAGEGGSAAPLNDRDGARMGWTTMSEYFALLDSSGLPVNVAQTIGHTQVRSMVLGDSDRRPSVAELDRMRGMVREAMQAGAIGVSTALIYPPAVYAPTEEIVALAKVAGEFGGKYFTHMRNEGDRLLEAIDEAIDIGQSAKTPVHIFHLKTAGKQNWVKMPLAIARIQAARSQGLQVTADVYPYVNNGLGVSALIHPRHFAAGMEKFLKAIDSSELRAEIRREMETTEGWENWFRHVGYDWGKIVIGKTTDRKFDAHLGHSIQDAAGSLGQDPWDTFFDLVRADAFVLPQSMSEANKVLAIQQDFLSFCTDVGPAGGDSFASHPRAYGAFPRLLSNYVRNLGAISLERAIAKASSLAANNIMAYDRGRIAPGLAADIIVFDYASLKDQATFEKPDAVAEGMRFVMVNGKVVLENGQLTKERPGRVLRGPGYDAKRAPHRMANGLVPEELLGFDQRMRDFMELHHVPGAAVAITHQSRIVFARGYGYADVASAEQVQPESLFRIASISKPITAMAIVQLVEKGKLKLDDQVFSVLPYDHELAAAGKDLDVRLKQITIRNLLEHSGGWDRDVSFDAMFRSVRFANEQNMPPPADQRAIIASMLKQPLDFSPGERYAYSNFGYCLLGRVIEQMTGKGYEQYVQNELLKPLGITGMRLGKTRLADRAAGEVRYYQPGQGKSVFDKDLGQTVQLPYGAWNLEAMDSHGGWLASAVDLAKLATAFDDPNHCPVLSSKSIELMFARPTGALGYEADGKPKEVFYSLGWQNRVVENEGAETKSNNAQRFNRWHTGSLDGTATILIRRHDGINMVALLNTRASPTTSHLGREIDSTLQRAINEIRQWPK